MTDARGRELEREFRRSGAVGDEAAWLGERVRIGELTMERLGLAARLGHPACSLISRPASPARALKAWIEQLVRPAWPDEAGWGVIPLGWQVAVRAAVAIARAIPAPRAEERMGWLRADQRVGALQALGAAESWCRCPCLAHSVKAWEVLGSGWKLGGPAEAYAGAARVAGTPGGTDVFPGRERTLKLATAVCEKGAKLAGGAARARGVLREALLPWALGQGEPLGL